MKIQAAEESARNEKLFEVALELDPANGIHEAYLVLNAIALRSRQAFHARSTRPNSDRRDKYQMLKDATEEYVEAGIDKLGSSIMRLAREKSRENILTDSILVKATDRQLKYIHDGLVSYRDGTPAAIANEMESSGGNLAALTRTNESITADHMIVALEADAQVPVADLSEERHPIGFGRVLVEQDAS